MDRAFYDDANKFNESNENTTVGTPIEITTQSSIHSVAFLADGKHFVSGAEEGKIRYWSVEDGKEVGRSMDAGSAVYDIAVSRDGRWLVSGTMRGSVTVWRVDSRTKVIEHRGHGGWVHAVDVSPDGTRVASGSADEIARVWSRSTGEEIFEWKHDGWVVGVKFSPDGRRIATATQYCIAIHDNQNGNLLFEVPIKVSSRYNHSLTWDNNSEQLLVSSTDRNIYILNANSREVRVAWSFELSEGQLPYHRNRQCILAKNSKYIAASYQSFLFWDTDMLRQIWSTNLDSSWQNNIWCMAMSNHILVMGGGHQITILDLHGILPSHYVDSPFGYFSSTSRRISRKLDPTDLTNRITRDRNGPVASGGFADIYQGSITQTGESTRVAIKAIKTYSEEDDDFRKKQKRLRREIKVWFNLQHANVLPLLGTTTGFGRFPAMVCPWAENGTLMSYLEDHYESLTEIDFLRLLGNVASGLDYLHSHSVVHGDLSGSNVLIREDGGACIADFGLSMLLTELSKSTFATSFHARGTLRWTAPELLDLEVLEDGMGEEASSVFPTTQSDVYSFGGIMLQILTGKMPYHYYMREGQIVHAISKGITPRRPSSTLVTDSRWAFIERCWSIVDGPLSRPSSEEIAEFTGKELDHANTS